MNYFSKLLKSFLSPFPYSRGFVKESVSVLRACLLATIVLFLLKPFGLKDASSSTIVGFGVAVLCSAFLNLAISQLLLKKFIEEEKWTVWKEVIRTLIYLAINVIVIMFYAQYALIIELDGDVVLRFVSYTLLFAVVPISVRVIGVNNWLLKQQLLQAKELASVIEKNESVDSQHKPIVLESNIVKDVMKVDFSNLLYIEAETNYINVILNEEGAIKKRLLRLSLVKAQQQINNKAIIRCHRSYLINIHNISKVTGNSQGLKLIFSEELQPIPVSRTYKEEVIERINTLPISSK